MMDRLIRIIRGLCGDNLSTKSENHPYGSSNVFTLFQDNANALLSTLIDGVALQSGQSASLSGNDVTVVASLTTGEVLTFKFDYYSNFSDAQIKAAIESALSYISIKDLKDFYYNTTDEQITPYPNKKEEYLIAIIASIILKPNYTMYSTSTIEVRCAGNKSKEEKIDDVLKNYHFNPSLIFGTEII